MPTIAFAHLLLASTFLNGVNIDGVRSLSFEKCRTVKIDARGDVRLDCPGYQVEAAGAAGHTPLQAGSSAALPVAAATPVQVPVPAAQLTRHYWLVSEQGGGGDAQLDVDLFVNSKWVRKLKSSEDQIVMEITRLLQPGQNKLLLAVTRTVAAGKRPPPPGATLRIIVGEGEAGGGNVLIDNPLVEFKRSAAETESADEEFLVQAR